MSSSVTNDQDTRPNVPEFSVTELANTLKRAIEDQFGRVKVRAEISGLSRPASGHVYFALKDQKSVIDGVMWRGSVGRLSFKPEDGLEVVCTGKLTTYGARSKYQIIVERMEPAGAGALMALLEARKKKLAAEGFFDPDRKKKIPSLPRHIGVVTSPTGAVIRDILHRLADRFPTRVTIWPVKVQGDGADQQIAAGIRGFNQLKGQNRPDLIIVARGGGSIEDLWSFNEECVVKAVFESDIPLISAVGHETDTTLIDYASDQRAPTPSGAAEMAVPVRADLVVHVKDLSFRLDRSLRDGLKSRKQYLDGMVRGLPKPSDILGVSVQRLDDLSQRLPAGLRTKLTRADLALSRASGGLSHRVLSQQLIALKGRLEGVGARLPGTVLTLKQRSQDRLTSAARLLVSYSYQGVLERGFVLVQDQAGRALTSIEDISQRDEVDLTFKDGRAKATINALHPLQKSDLSGKAPPSQKLKRTPALKKPKNQGELF